MARIIFILFSSAFLFGSMVSMVDAEYDKSAQTIKITQDMKDWIGIHFDRKVKGEHLSVSEIEFQEGRFYLKVLSGDGKVLRRMVKSAAEAKEMLKEINNGDPLINYIDKIIEKQRGADKKPGAYDNRTLFKVKTGKPQSQATKLSNITEQEESVDVKKTVKYVRDEVVNADIENVASIESVSNADTGNKSVTISGDAEAIKGRWLGYYQKNRRDTFFWLDIRLVGDRVEAELEAKFPPLALAGEYDSVSHTFRLDPTHWVHGPPPGNPQLISLKGHYVAEHDVIYGNLSNVQGNPSFVAGRDIRPEAPENTGGLLFKITTDRKSAETLSLDDCRRYAEWLASSNFVKFGRYTFNSAVLNQNSMRNVLGRDMFQWQEEDSKKIKLISRACRRILSSSNDSGDENLAKKIRAPKPLNVSNKNRGMWHQAKVLLKQDTVQNLQALKLRFDEGLIALDAGQAGKTVQEFEGGESLVKRIEKGSGADVNKKNKIGLSSTVELPKTGQTTCYHVGRIGYVISCSGTGQDGEIQAGVAWPDPRFTDNGDGTMTDNLTGLIWSKDANITNTNSPSFDNDEGAGDVHVTWRHALDYVAGMNAGTYPNLGYTDWRLPNRNELESLVNVQESNPNTVWLNGQGFNFYNMQNQRHTLWYWSSTSYANNTISACRVLMNTGEVYHMNKAGKSYVWPVRSGSRGTINLPKTGQTVSYVAGDDGDLERGVSWPSPRFEDKGDSTVTDNLTGLMWTKYANIINTNSPSFDKDERAGDGKVTWRHALDYVAGMNAGTYPNLGYTDWRLPNINELKSLVNAQESKPSTWLNDQGFNNVQSWLYWSSTQSWMRYGRYGSDAINTDRVWHVDMRNGNVRYSTLVNTFCVWPVRSGWKSNDLITAETLIINKASIESVSDADTGNKSAAISGNADAIKDRPKVESKVARTLLAVKAEKLNIAEKHNKVTVQENHDDVNETEKHVSVKADKPVIEVDSDTEQMLPVTGVWTGRYVCYNRPTGLNLFIERTKPGSLRAYFHFFAVPENPMVPEGLFEMQGGFDSISGTLRLSPGRWIKRPSGYTTVGLTCKLNASADEMSGKVNFPGCKTFNLKRTQQIPQPLLQLLKAESIPIETQQVADTSKSQKVVTGPDLNKKDKSQTKESKKADAKPKQETRVTECDTLAAEPFDPGRITAGVSWGELDADSAIRACSQAVEAEPDSARLQYQYGRSLHKNEQYADAIKWYRKAVKQDYAAAQSNLGFLYANGQGVQKDYAEAVKWYRKAAEQNHAKAQYELGVMYTKGTCVPKNDVEAVKWWRKSAEQGYADAQYKLGFMYASGNGLPKNYAEAVKWWRKADEQDHAGAQYNLGVMYANGNGVTKNDAEAVKWYRKAAEQGYAAAQSNLGLKYENGQGVPKDYAEAVKWYLKAAEQGDADAQYSLGVMYNNGQGVQKDYAEAVKWWRKAAEQGIARAQYNLGWMYADGQGVQKDYVEAVKWYRKAAEQGHASAQCNLGWMYENGNGVQKGYAEAVNWYRKAAEQGHADAQSNLGVMYANGRGVPKNDAEAVKWYRKASEQGHEKAKKQLALLKKAGDSEVNKKDKNGETALMVAAREGQTETVRELLNKGADVNEKDSDKYSGQTALMFAAGEGHTETVRVLLSKGADVNAKSVTGRTALLFALPRCHTETVRVLLDKGANVNDKDKDGWTALMRAAHQGCTEMAQALIDNGADVNVRNNEGKTALDLAGIFKDDIVALLEEKQQKSIEKDKSQTKKTKAQTAKIDPELVKKAEAGDPEAQYNLGLIYRKGPVAPAPSVHQRVQRNYAKGTKWLRKAAEQGHADAQFNLGVGYAISGLPGDDANAVKWLRKAAEGGFSFAQNRLGLMYAKGQGVKKNYAEAEKWWRKAAEQDHMGAQYNLGRMYANGYGVLKNNAEAVKWYRKAAEQGNANAQSNLGWMYYNGHGVQKDYAEAAKWFRKAAEQGDVSAQTILGLMYNKGFGLPKDYAEAIKWWRKAAEQGDVSAQTNIGLMYTNGYGVPKDYAEAVKWFRKSAEKGFVGAQYHLGTMYYTGRGVQKDYAEAVKWFRKSAEKGYADAQFNLGLMYHTGDGVSKNHTESVKWYRKAAEQGDEEAKKQLALLEGKHSGTTSSVRETLSSPDSPMAGAPLHSEKRVKVDSGVFGTRGWGYGQRVRSQFQELVAQGQEVLVCSYPDDQIKASPLAPPGSGFDVYKFWYEKVPYTRRQLRTTPLKYHGQGHPFLEIPEIAITSCPPGLENAKALRAKYWK